jgi:hypothetical protein
MKYLTWIDYSFRKGGEWIHGFHFTISPGLPLGIGSASIRPAPRYDVPDASAGILDIAGPSGYQVDVAVKNRLTCRFARVDPHVEARNQRIDGLQSATLILQETLDSGLLGPV